MSAAISDIGPRIDELWSDEGCSWQVRLDGGKWWTVVLEWWTDWDCPHSANYMTLTWDFYDESLDVALAEAVAWCEELAVWRPCAECDGHGAWNGKPCQTCNATGLEGGSHE